MSGHPRRFPRAAQAHRALCAKPSTGAAPHSSPEGIAPPAIEYTGIGVPTGRENERSLMESEPRELMDPMQLGG
jgi:hypothetical protein